MSDGKRHHCRVRAPTLWDRVTALLAALLCCLAGAPVLACQGGGGGPYPLCDIPAPEQNEHVILVRFYSEHTLTNLALGEMKESPFLIDVVVGNSDRPLYVFLDGHRRSGAIFRFSGNTKAISRVVTFRDSTDSLTGHAPRLVGIVGLPREKVAFAPIVGFDPVIRTTCGFEGPPHCRVGQLFKGVDQSQLLNSFNNNMPDPGTHKADHIMHVGRSASIQIPPASGDVDVFDYDTSKPGQNAASKKWQDDEPLRARMSTAELDAYFHPGGVAMLKPEDLISPPDLKVGIVTQLPDLAGAAVLEKQGVMFRPGSPEFQKVYDRWDDVISTPHRTRFQPNLRLSLPVDYVVTGPVDLPRFKDKIYISGERNAFYTVVLVENGVPAPQVPEASRRGTCIVYADGRMERPCHQIDPRYSFATWNDLFKAQPSASDCRVIRSPPEGSAVAVWVYAGRDVENPNQFKMSAMLSRELPERFYGKPQGQEQTPGRADIHIKKPGKVFLYLHNDRYVEWHVTVGPDSEITGVMLVSSLGTKATGLAPGTPVMTVNSMLIANPACQRLVQTMQSTNAASPPNSNDLRRGFQALAGREFDVFLSKPFPGDLRQSIEADPIRLKDYTTYVVE